MDIKETGLDIIEATAENLLPPLDNSNGGDEPIDRSILFNPLDLLKKKKREWKPTNPQELRQTMFPLGVSLIDGNVKSCGNAGRMVKVFTYFAPLRHTLYANAIADGVTNFISGTIYAFYTQSKAFGSVWETSPSSLVGAMMGIWTQAVIYCCCGFFIVPIILFKLATVDMQQLQQEWIL
ncbi:hypothetical protein DSO57_1036201 [Entomophthora muscae]|uniref:Uncharacterized protein n=1 Tax=Entomophthora muscae TaxID=34485 RepID=A0ACC2RQ73_9FUNG|nr:hypothetical protein DSO57_1036201 [Entomophthora muscae]